MGQKESQTGTGVAIYMWDAGGLNILIPKRRGEGYLKCPLGHHVVPALSDIEAQLCDLCGLDGFLQVDYYRHPYGRSKTEAEAVAKIMPMLAKHFGFSTWREDTKLFWQIVIPK